MAENRDSIVEHYGFSAVFYCLGNSFEISQTIKNA